MKISVALALAPLAALVCACGSDAPVPESLRAVRTVEVRYDDVLEATRYFASVKSRSEVDQGFRVGGKVIERRVDVGQRVREGDVLAILDDEDYRLAVEAAHQQFEAATARAEQAESDWRRFQALKADGSVSDSDDEHAASERRTSRAAAEAEARKLELARNQVSYTQLRASIGGVVTSVGIEIGQVVAAGQPAIAVANDSTPEIVVDVPEDDLETFRAARYRATLATSTDSFELVLRELSAQAVPQTRTYRARLQPATPRSLPLGATATLIAERVTTGQSIAAIPASALTQSDGDPALWVVHRDGKGASGSVELVPVNVREYRSELVLISGPPAGTLVVTAGVQKMAPGLRVALTDSAGRSPVEVADAR